MNTVLHIVIRTKHSEDFNQIIFCYKWGPDGETKQCELMKKELRGSRPAEQVWYLRVDADTDENFKNLAVTDNGELKKADTEDILTMSLRKTIEESSDYPVQFNEELRFVPHFVADKKAEFVIFSDISKNDFRVIPMIPLCLIFEIQTPKSVSSKFYIEANYSELNGSSSLESRTFKKSRLLCTDCKACENAKQDHGDTQVWTLTIEKLQMVNYNGFMRLPTGEPLSVKVMKEDAEAFSGSYDINLSVDGGVNPTQTYLIKLDRQAEPQVFRIAHCELHFKCEIKNVDSFDLRGNCHELGPWKEQFKCKKNESLRIFVAAVVVEMTKGSKFLKTFDLRDFQFEALLHFAPPGETSWPKTYTISHFEVPLQTFSVFTVEIKQSRLQTRLSIEPVVTEVTHRLHKIAGSTSTNNLRFLVPKLHRHGRIYSEDDDPQRTHDIWGEDPPMETRDDIEPEAKSGLTYLKLRQTRHQHESLCGRRIVLKRLSKQYHRYQDEAVRKLLDWNADEVRKAALNKICRGGASDSEYKNILQALATEILQSRCSVADHSLLLWLAAAIVRGRAEALVLSPRAQAWQQTNWERHMVAAECWFRVVLALWETRPDERADFREAIRRAGESPAFYTWREN
ncbi:hypothetical protein BOX15_Mlig031750g1 [Macrostomum lignano]|uniref:Uncharacterized protein n=1 Tax=Macrostomum lignano TaxID=282301 RepID=A0A267DAU9_9PLAT|nr:hypothetical protein BOX15_Mlig031750g2 [Macrostomum lignano]PAA58457.1 hypothetical protein BOX15_Mlig031750g1 [Macrostomum lignano]